MQEIAVQEISLWKLNPRKIFNHESLEELAASIKEIGIIQPIVLRPIDQPVDLEEFVNINAKYAIVAGDRRYRAAIIAGLKAAPAIVKEISKEQAIEIACIENLQREDITAIEEAHAYQTYLQETKVTQTELAKKLGVSQGHIANRIRLLKLPEEYQQKVISGGITPTTARDLASLADRPGAFEEISRLDTFGYSLDYSIKSVKQNIEHEEEQEADTKKARELAANEIEENIADIKDAGLNAVAGADFDETGKKRFNWQFKPDDRCKLCDDLIFVVDAELCGGKDEYEVDDDAWCCKPECFESRINEKDESIRAANKESGKRKSAIKREVNKRKDVLDLMKREESKR